MKRLAVSLLRLGDILMLVPALQSLKVIHPDDELHLLINENFKHIEPLLPFIDKIHFFPREVLQQDLSDSDTPILAAFDKLDHFLEDLNRNNYQEVINFTHNTLSACVSSLIKADRRVGLQVDAQDQLMIQGNWFQILNQPASKMPWHFSEVYLKAVGEEGYRPPIFPGENQRAESRLLLQPFTSEDRKFWSPDNWRKYLGPILKDNIFKQCEVLAAPFEKEKAERFIQEINLQNHSIGIYCCHLEEALVRIRQSQLLITVDTSIKHLAAGTRISIIELALGGSRAEHTGAFRDNVLVLSSPENSPPTQGVFHVTKGYLKNHLLTDLGSSASCEWGEWRASVSCLTDSGSWTLVPLYDNQKESVLDELGNYMEACFLQDEQGKYLGSSAFNCVETLKTHLSPSQWKDLARQLAEKEKDCEESLDRIRSMRTQIRSEISESSVVDYSKVQTFSKCIGKLKRKQEYNRRFLRTVKLHVMEMP